MDFYHLKLLYSTEDLPLETLPVPGNSTILIQKSEGSRKPALSIGDTLKSGQKILCEGGRFMEFSPVTGKVSRIHDINWVDGLEFTAVSVETVEDDWSPLFKADDNFLSRDKNELSDMLKEAGFDIDIPADSEGIIVNFFEKDILLSNHRKILKDRKDNIRKGIELLKKIGSTDVIAAGPKELLDEMKDVAAESDIKCGSGKYPDGLDALLPRTLFGKSGIGSRYFIVNADTLDAMVETLKSGIPNIEKLITLVSKGPAKNLRVRVGTPVSEILKANSIDMEDNGKILLSGPMRGRSISTADFPVTPDTDAVIVQQGSEVREVSNRACLNCGKCVEVCPNRLQVNLLTRYSEFLIFEKCKDLDIDYCIECGLCAYVCTCRRPLVQLIQFAKGEIEKLNEEEEE